MATGQLMGGATPARAPIRGVTILVGITCDDDRSSRWDQSLSVAAVPNKIDLDFFIRGASYFKAQAKIVVLGRVRGAEAQVFGALNWDGETHSGKGGPSIATAFTIANTFIPALKARSSSDLLVICDEIRAPPISTNTFT